MTTRIEELLSDNANLARDVLGAGAAAIDRERRFPKENLSVLGDRGLLGLLVPTEYGGAGGDLAEMSAVLEQMAQGCASTAMVVMMHYCGVAVLAAKGSAKLKQNVLPEIARGKHLTTLAFSEPGSGGHFYAPISQLRAIGEGFVLNANKSFVTGGAAADSYVVSTRSFDAKGPQDLDLFL